MAARAESIGMKTSTEVLVGEDMFNDRDYREIGLETNSVYGRCRTGPILSCGSVIVSLSCIKFRGTCTAVIGGLLGSREQGRALDNICWS